MDEKIQTEKSLFECSDQDVERDVAVGEVDEVEDKTDLERSFSLWSTLGMQYSITSTPLAVGTYLSVSIGVGGSPFFFFGYLLAAVMNLCVCASLAEIAAVFPHASGQIYWTAVLAPKKHARALSYISGWITCAAWFFWTAATFLVTSELFWALVQICHESFVTLPWHFYVAYVGCGVTALVVNIPLFKYYPYLLKGLMVYINAGAVFVLVVLLVRAHPKESASYVFNDIVNDTGWSSNGVVFFLALLPGLTSVNGFDAAAHMVDELPAPARQVPQVMMGGALLSALSGIPMILVYMFCIVNPTNLLTPVGGQPIAQLMVDSFDSQALTIIGSLVFIICLGSACSTLLTTFSRVWWSFAREGGVPFSGFMAEVNERWRLPINSICFCFVACVVIGAIELGSSTALNAILGTAVICIFTSYAIPIVCLLVRGRSHSFPGKRYFNLGRWGPVFNVVSVAWAALEFVWLCFPLYVPVTADTMNYAVAVLVGVVFVSGVNWIIYSKRVFTTPEEMYAT